LHGPDSFPDPRGVLNERQLAALASAARGDKLNRSESVLLIRMRERGWLPACGSKSSLIAHHSNERVWLPNELVDVPVGGASPIELMRKSGDPMALKLLIDLYTAQRLDEWHGIDPAVGVKKFRELRRYELGKKVIIFWSAIPERTSVASVHSITADHYTPTEPNDPFRNFYERLETLEESNLLEYVPHVLDGDGVPVYPCSPNTGLPEERALAASAERAARYLLAEEGLEPPQGRTIAAIVPRLLKRATLAGIARLTHRPRTKMTAKWRKKLSEVSRAWSERFRAQCDGQMEFGETGTD